jgi:hypothetical protein
MSRLSSLETVDASDVRSGHREPELDSVRSRFETSHTPPKCNVLAVEFFRRFQAGESRSLPTRPHSRGLPPAATEDGRWQRSRFPAPPSSIRAPHSGRTWPAHLGPSQSPQSLGASSSCRRRTRGRKASGTSARINGERCDYLRSKGPVRPHLSIFVS